ncbi:lipopolysaccharide biosynthesis protein [Vogesella mureinivorans]|uniref:lipopolysaccharide biosynthesis protein n=1 Tax=Vogesella mureinivorans TaxID=657276 RepID=UPI0011C817C2|nr:oligosaccharide flippase family protein [Vogesella mureinivorans]
MSFVRGGLSISIANLVNAMVSVALIPLLIRGLGDEAYGYMVFVQTIAVVLFYLVSKFEWVDFIDLASGKNLATRKIYSRLALFGELRSLAVTFVLALPLGFIYFYFSGEKKFSALSVAFLVLTAGLQSIGTLSAFFRVLNAEYANFFGLIATAIIRCLSIYIGVFLENSIDLTIFLLFLSELPKLVSFLIVSDFSWRNLYSSKNRKNGHDSVVNSGRWYKKQVLADLPVSQFDKIIIGAFFGAGDLAVFNLFKRCFSIANTVCQPFNMGALPKVNELKVTKREAEIFSLLRKFFVCAATISSIGAGFLVLSFSYWAGYVYPGFAKYKFEFSIFIFSISFYFSTILISPISFAYIGSRKSFFISLATSCSYFLILAFAAVSQNLSFAIFAFLLYLVLGVVTRFSFTIKELDSASK